MTRGILINLTYGGLSVTIFAFFVFISLLFEDKIFVWFGGAFALILYLVLRSLLGESISLPTIRAQLSNFANPYVVATFIAVLALLVVPDFDSLNLNLRDVPVTNVLRFISALYLTTFSSGYFLLRLIDKQGKFSGVVAIVLSYLFSIFVSFLIGFSSLVSQPFLGVSLTTFFLITFNLLLAFLFLILKRKSTWHVSLTLSEGSAIVLIALILLVGASLYVIAQNFPMPRGDMWRHLWMSQVYTKRLPVHGNILVGEYHYLFPIYLASLTTASGLPHLVTYNMIFLLTPIGILALYATLGAWFNKPSEKKIRDMGAFLGLLLGYGSLYVLCLKLVAPTVFPKLVFDSITKTYDIFDLRVLTPFSPYPLPLYLIGLPSFLALITLVKVGCSKPVRCLLTLVVFIVGFIGHIPEMLIAGFILLSYGLVVQDSEVKKNCLWILLSMTLGTITVGILDLFTTVPTLVTEVNFNSGSRVVSSFYLSIVIFYSLSTLLLYGFTRRKLLKEKKFSFDRLEKGWRYARWVLLYLYLLAVLTWLVILPGFDARTYGGYSFVPLLIFPVRIGPVGMLAIISIVFFLPDLVRDKRTFIFLIMFLTGLALEQISNFLPLIGQFYAPYKYAFFIFLGALALIAFALSRLFTLNIRACLTSKQVLALTALVILILPGMVTTAMHYSYASQIDTYWKANLTKEELQALRFVKENLPGSSSIIAVSGFSEEKLLTFAGLDPLQIPRTWNYLILETRSIGELLYVLSKSRAQFFYVSQTDKGLIQGMNGVFKSLLPYLPIAFSNKAVTIYEIPPIAAPTINAQFAVLGFLPIDLVGGDGDILPASTEGNIHYYGVNDLITASLPAIAGINYSIFVEPSESLTTPVITEVRTDASAWLGLEGSAAVVDDASVVHFENITTDSNGLFAMRMEGPWNLSNTKYIIVKTRLPSERVKRVKFFITDVNWHSRVWIFNDPKEGKWLNVTLSMNQFTNEQEPVNLSAIKFTAVGFTEPTKPNSSFSPMSIASVRFIKLNRHRYPLPIQELQTFSSMMITADLTQDGSSLTSWVENGGKLIVFESSGKTEYFSDLLGLTVIEGVNSDGVKIGSNHIALPKLETPKIVTKPSVEIIANYTWSGESTSPFLLRKKIGLGEINYAVAWPIYTREEQLDKLLTDLSSIFKLMSDSLGLSVTESQRFIDFPVYQTLEKTTTFNGVVSLKSDDVVLSQQTTAGLLQISSRSLNITITAVDVLRLRIEGEVKVAITGKVRMLAEMADSYVTLHPSPIGDENNYTFALSDTAHAEISIVSFGKLYNLTQLGGTLNIASNELHLLARNPMLNVTGMTQFEAARIPIVPYIPLMQCVRDELQINGTVNFQVIYATVGQMMISDFTYHGMALKIRSSDDLPWKDLAPLRPLQLIISWREILFSYPNVALLGLLVLLELREISKHRRKTS